MPCKTGIYETPSGFWVLVRCGGRGAEHTYMPRTNDHEAHRIICDAFNWSRDWESTQTKLDALAEKLGWDEVPWVDVLETYPQWEYKTC